MDIVEKIKSCLVFVCMVLGAGAIGGEFITPTKQGKELFSLVSNLLTKAEFNELTSIACAEQVSVLDFDENTVTQGDQLNKFMFNVLNDNTVKRLKKNWSLQRMNLVKRLLNHLPEQGAQEITLENASSEKEMNQLSKKPSQNKERMSEWERIALLNKPVKLKQSNNAGDSKLPLKKRVKTIENKIFHVYCTLNNNFSEEFSKEDESSTVVLESENNSLSQLCQKDYHKERNEGFNGHSMLARNKTKRLGDHLNGLLNQQTKRWMFINERNDESGWSQKRRKLNK